VTDGAAVSAFADAIDARHGGIDIVFSKRRRATHARDAAG
jgi:NAD(P)-dependent dehydrogenase (short-subunit alcohol dehydrogenase family)